MGARASRPQEDTVPVPAPPPPGPSPYVQYPPAPQPYMPMQPPPQPAPYYPSNGQYYGGYTQQYPPHMLPSGQPMSPQEQGPHQRLAYPHAPRPPMPAQPAPPRPHPPPQKLTQTSTIKNYVNLKKSSLKVTPLPDDPTKLAISFTFDAAAPCCVTTFVGALEYPKDACILTTELQPPAPAVFYNKGLSHVFPGSAASAEVAAGHVIHLELYGPEPLRTGPLAGCRFGEDVHSFPLAVRLETVTEAGIKAGHSLSELTPGGRQQSWMQSQTTFAALHRDEDGSWTVRVLKQKLWVEGTAFEMAEIYGIEHMAAGSATAAATVSTEQNEERLCVICLVAPRDTTVLPCRHMCMCSECADELRKQSNKCPICRNHVDNLLEIRGLSPAWKREPSASAKRREAVAAAAAAAAAAGAPP